jgi:hypothetical protein
MSTLQTLRSITLLAAATPGQLRWVGQLPGRCLLGGWAGSFEPVQNSLVL